MRLLLDTHTFLWWLDGDRRLSPKARKYIADERHVILLSAASAWEIATKARLGKLPGALEVAADVAGAAASQGFTALDITILHADQRFARGAVPVGGGARGWKVADQTPPCHPGRLAAA